MAWRLALDALRGRVRAAWALALLEKNPHPSDKEIREALRGLKCRCGTHTAILRAVKRAAAMMG